MAQQFASKIGLIATTVGSAVGLGNIWRFPAEAQQNGGSAFLFLYILCVFVLGIPVMLAEFSLGRGARTDALGVFHKFSPGSRWWLIGVAGIVTSYLITSFYMVVEGWTVEYLWESLTGALYDGTEGGGDVARQVLKSRMQAYVVGPWLPLGATWLVILINMFVLMGGVQKGLERLSNVMMPLLFVILIFLGVIASQLPGASQGLAFFFRPDFSKITAETVINALGQTFFSLSLGVCILMTYAGYYPSDAHLRRTAVIVSMMSILVGVLVGCIIFPAVATFHISEDAIEGTTLVFVSLPQVFAAMGNAQLWSILFFALLFMAALTSTLSLLEVTVRFLQERTPLGRKGACVATCLPLMALSSLSVLSFGPLEGLKLMGYTVFNFLDTMATNILLPAVAICICVYLGWFAPRGLIYTELTNGGLLSAGGVGLVRAIVRFVAPALIAAILISNFV